MDGIRQKHRHSRRGLLAAALALLAAACSPLTAFDTVLPRAKNVSVTEGVSYANGLRHKLDIYVPAGVGAPAGPRPAVVFFYGGSWRSGARGEYRFVGEALAARGIVVVIPDYRIYPEVGFPGFMVDAARAVRWVRNNARRLGIDPARLQLAGHSAGANIAATLVLDPTYLERAGMKRGDIAAVIALAGPYGFDPLKTSTTRPVFERVRDIDAARPLALAERAVSAGDAAALPRFTLLHGETDETVLPANSVKLAEALRKGGVEVTLKTYKDIGHYRLLLALSQPFLNWAPVLDDVTRAAGGIVPPKPKPGP
jgi:acetyl esterase/lipase